MSGAELIAAERAKAAWRDVLDKLFAIVGPLTDETSEHFDIAGAMMRRPDVEEDAVAIIERHLRPAEPSPVAAWQPIETAPKDGTPVVLIGTLQSDPRRIRACLTQWYENERDSPCWAVGWCFAAPGFMDLFVPTHWTRPPVSKAEQEKGAQQ